LDGCRPIVANADDLFRKSTAGERKQLQTQRILCMTAVELEMHWIEPVWRFPIRQAKHTNTILGLHQGGSRE